VSGETDPFMARAIELAIENVRSGRGGPFACVVVRDGRILAEGTNEVTASGDPTAHAEVVAIRAACRALGDFQLAGCDLYTSCEPCPMCLGAIYWARPARVFFAGTASDAAVAGFDDAEIYREVALPAAARRIPFLPLMRAEAAAAFRAWSEKTDRIPY
jgi:guanine deaminase